MLPFPGTAQHEFQQTKKTLPHFPQNKDATSVKPDILS